MLKLICWAALVHFVLLYSIFDIYFTSPVIHGMEPIKNEVSPVAKRLVLIVSDGLRADAFYEPNYYHNQPMPYLRSIVDNAQGSWGISHTHVPTESRPGHVAIIAGMYEDPSAVWKGWKVNPVEFDTVFNESNMAWCWGSPDIINLFKFSETQGNIALDAYDAEFEDFSGSATSLLDKWVFDKFAVFIKQRSSAYLCGKFCETKIIFFLHLLGMDTAGHVFKPHSEQYRDNMIEVDSGVQKIVELMELAFPDHSTAYIFTADHGMTNWGSHGSGLDSETQTPLIAWGAGIANSHLKKDVNQADIAPLIATLIGIPIPLNSVGVLPTSYLDMDLEHKAHAVFTNALQLLAQFKVKHETLSKNSFSLLFTPYEPLTEVNLLIKVGAIRLALNSNKYEIVIEDSVNLIDDVLRGLQYYQNYHQWLLLSCTVLGTIFWIIYLLSMLNAHGPRAYIWEYNYFDHIYDRLKRITNRITVAICAVVFPLLFFQKKNGTFYIYVSFPIITGWLLFHNIKYAHILRDRIFSLDSRILMKRSVVYIFGIEMLVLSFFNRGFISVLICFLAFWARGVQSDVRVNRYWTATSILLTVFPLLNVVGEKYNPSYMNVAGLAWIGVSLFLFNRETYPIGIENLRVLITLTVQTIVCVVAFLNTLIVNYTFENKNGISMANQALSWIILVSSFVSPLFGSTFIISRVMNIILAFMAPYVLMSVKQEPLFMLIMTLNLIGWLLIEYKTIFPNTQLLCGSIFQPYRLRVKRLDQHDLRLAFFYIYFIMVSFFGTGNIASLNSFDPAQVHTFVSVFSPLTMMSLLLIKILIPFFITTVMFLAITTLTKAVISKIFFLILIICEIMTLHFLFLVKNVGSWLDIGQSISHFAIMNLITIFLLILFVIAKGLTTFTVTVFD